MLRDHFFHMTRPGLVLGVRLGDGAERDPLARGRRRIGRAEVVVDEDRDPGPGFFARGIQYLLFRDQIILVQKKELNDLGTFEGRSEEESDLPEVQSADLRPQRCQCLFIHRARGVTPLIFGFPKGHSRFIGYRGAVSRRGLARGELGGKAETAREAALPTVGFGQEPVYLDRGFHDLQINLFDDESQILVFKCHES